YIRFTLFPTLRSSDLLRKGDCLVLNDTRVLPARLYGSKKDTGAKIEVLLLHQQNNDKWEVLIKPAKKVNIGTILTFGEGELEARSEEHTSELQSRFDL